MGWFRIDRQVLMNDERLARKAFEGLIIHDLHRHFDYGQCTMYLAEGEVFDEVPEGYMAPNYDAVFDAAKGTVEFVRREEKNGDASSYAPSR